MIRTDIVKQAQVEDRLYIIDDNPHQIIVDSSVNVVYVPQDYLESYKEVNTELMVKMKPYNYNEVRKTKPEFYKQIAVIMTSESNAPVMALVYSLEWCANKDYMTLAEAEAVTNEDIGENFKDNLDITHFEEFQYFTGITALPKYAFWGMDNLEVISFPLSLKVMGAQILGIGATNWNNGHRSKLKIITGLKNVEETGSNCFQHLTELISADFSQNLKRVGGSLFMHCPSIEDYGDFSGVESCSGNILAGCDKISSVYTNIPCKMPSCKNLHNIQIPWETLTALPFNFIGSDGATGHEGANIEEIPNMPNLTTLTVSSNKSIAFQNCLHLKYFGRTPKLTSVPMGAFLGCCRLKEVKDLSSVTTILQQGFDMCFALEGLDLPICTNVGANAFRLNSSMTEGNFAINFGKAYSQITFASTAFAGRHKSKCKIICNGTELTDEQYAAVGVSL